jgi:hypothetical protein
VAVAQAGRVIASVPLLFAPDRLTLEQDFFLSVWDTAFVPDIINAGDFGLDDGGLIEKRSLLEFQETAALVLHGDD